MTRRAARNPGRGPGRFSPLIGLLLSLVLAIAAAPVALAQNFSFTNVAIEGNTAIEPETILALADIGRGETVSAAELNDALQRVQGSGLFEEVAFEPRGNTLVIRVTEFPIVGRISIEGNQRLDDDTLLGLISSQPRRVFSPSQAEADAEAIIEAYRVQGRLAATVDPRIIRRPDNTVDLVFEVFEGRVVEIQRISFVGNRAFSDRRLRNVLETRQAGLLRTFVRSDTFVAERIAFDRRLLTDFYNSRGYVDFQVLDVSPEFARERNAFFLTFTLREGQQFRFGQVSVASEVPGIDADDFADQIRVTPGRVYNPAAIDLTVTRMENLATRRGLNFVRVDPRVTRNDRAQTLDIQFVLTRGPRIFVERIDIEGNQTTLDRVIRRQFRTVEGDPFNPREIRQAAERIRALGFFSDAEVNAREGTRDGQVIVDVDVTEQPTGSLSFGASYGVETGVGLAVSFAERNFLGRGQTLRFEFNTGFDNSSSSLTFIEPAFLGRDLTFRLTTRYREAAFDYTDYDTEQFSISPSISFPISENSRLGFTYELAQDDIFNVDEDSSSILVAEEEQGRQITSSVGYFYSYDTRRSGLNPNAGILFRWAQDFAGVGGDREFIRTTAELTGERRILNEEVTLRATLEGGALTMLNDQESRITDRFFLNSSRMRGFEPAGVGPRDLTVENEDALGGNYFAVARFETEFPLGLPEEYGLTGGLFLDVGSVWGLDNDGGGVVDDDFALRSVVGFSLFWTTGLGPLRFNFSTPIEKEEFDEESNFDFTISTRF